MEQVCEKTKVKKKKREKSKAVSSTSDATKDGVEEETMSSTTQIKPTPSKVLDLQLETPTNDVDSCEEINEEPTKKEEKPPEKSETTETEIAEETRLSLEESNPISQLQSEEDEMRSLQDYTKLNANLANIMNAERAEIKIEQITAPTHTVRMKPYTESQLAALYTNSELGMLEQFTTQYVEAELRGLAGKQHPLYDLLSNYLQVRGKIIGNSLELEQLRKEYGELQETLWTTDMVTINGRGECQDGSTVTAAHSYQKATFHRSVFQSIVRILGLVRKLSHDNYALYSYSAEDLRLQIELYIQTAIGNCITVSGIQKNSPVILSLQDEPLHLKPYLTEIRLCISVLFAFQRRLVKDPQFLKETREWLGRLVAVLLRLATYQDHLFILSHILRCPAGVGSWACSFIQIPLEENVETPFSSCQINHALSILETILSPVKERDRFMEDLAQQRDNSDNFVIVDSEGEEDEETGTSLRENDLVAMVTQLPLESLFRSVLLIENSNFENRYKPDKVTQHHILRFFAFSTILLKIINKGLKTYNQQRYNQFSKRLSRFIRHIVQYATDQWEQFRNDRKNVEDEAMMERLAVEYDSFFLRAIYYLYTAQKLGAWQFLAVVPYDLIDIKTAWKIYYFLHDSDVAAKEISTPTTDDYRTKMWNHSFRQQFEEKLTTVADDELYYLLNTFANIALARDENDMDFIESATKDILQMGFISLNTQEICSKTARTLLTHITSKHPHLLSLILKEVKDNLKNIGGLALYLYEELPLTVWKITDEDFAIISWLLTNEITSNESKLARMILSRSNWDLLPYDLHCEVALLVVRAVEQEPGYLNWGWQTILRLKLHLSDKAFENASRILDPEHYDALVKGIRQQQPLAVFVALLMTSWGHLVPVICSHGLPQLIFLQANQKHEAVLFVLYLVVPLFVNSQESIINDERFQEIILNLINADRGYISMAKSLVSAQSTVLQQFGNMIETQIVTFATYGLETPRCLVRLWMNSLVSIPGWNRDVGVMYLMDVVIRAAFFHSDALDAAYNILKDLQQCNSSQEQGGAFSSLFKWVSNTNTNGGLIAGSLASCPWLAYLIIDIEHEEREKRTGLWREILLRLDGQKGKVSVDNAIKKAASTLKLQAFTSGYLCIYRWAQQAMDTPLDHPLLPLLWQKFFVLYLTRNVTDGAADNRACVGDKFFEGLVNFTFFKKIKRRLQESLDFYQDKVAIYEDEDQEMKLFLEGCVNVFRSFSLWLEEPKLQKNNLILSSLPPLYQPELLAFIIQGDNTPWYVYLNYSKIKDDQSECIKIWKISNFRYKSNANKPLVNPGGTMEDPDPSLRILRRLGVYETPKPPPEIKNSAPIVPTIDFSSRDALFTSLEPCFKTLKQFAHNHIMKVSEHKALDCSYQELIPQLYRSVLNKITKKVPCKSRYDAVHCSGPAVIILEVQEARINDRIEHQILNNRNAYSSLLSKALQPPALNLCTASVTVQQAIKVLQSQVKCNPASSELGCELFYYVLSLINEETTSYLPTQTLFSSCIEKLGRSHICGVEVEMPRLLEKILKEPNLGGYLAPHFSPCNVGSASLLFMYAKITQEIGANYDVTFALLSKFDVDNWLICKDPKSSHRSEFIQSVVKALTVLGFEPQIEALTLHGLYRKHLLSVFEHQFPEHYGEVLIHLLKASNGNTDSSLLSKSVWLDILNSLSKPVEINPKLPLREQLRLYAHHQEMLQHQELLESAELFARHFTQERLQYGLYGLYPKCRNYIDVYVILLGMTGHGLIVSTIKVHEGLLGDQLSQKIWPYLINVFAPWLVPYSMQNLKENMAAWIQQLADDRSVLLPWIPTDMSLAQKVVAVFFECVQFLIHTLPGCGNILSFIWQWYVTCFAHTAVKEHVLGPIHHSFVAFPWKLFWPSVNDIECMVRVVDQYLPESHSFLGHIFVSVQWTSWLGNFKTSPQPIKSRIYHCFLNLLVKLSNEPNVRNKYHNKAKNLLIESETLDWRILEAPAFQSVVDWYVMSCDPVVIFSADPLNLDFRVLNFLKCVAEYNNNLVEHATANMQTKRLIYVKSVVKLMSVYANKHKTSVAKKESEINSVISGQLKHLEDVVRTQEEMDALLPELMGFVNIPNITQTSLKVFEKWISTKPGDGFVIKSLLKTARTCVTSNQALGFLMESTLTSYFQNNACNEYFNPSWSELGEIAALLSSQQTEFEQSLLSDGHILTLNAILTQKFSKWHETESLLNLAIDWISNIKINESIESKVPLLWCEILRLSLLHCDKDEPGTGAILYRFAKALLQLSEDRGGSRWGKGLLSVIGITKQDAVSIKFLCRALAGYVLAQLPDMKGEPQSVRRRANAPAKVGQPGGNSEAAKVLMSLGFGQSQGKIKECEELALKQIQDAANSMHNAQHFLRLIVKQFYTKTYLKAEEP